MTVLVVVHHPRDWPFEIAGTRVVTAREYLSDPTYSESQSARVLNLCRTDRYQGRGYYVSLLAEARGHRPLPEVKTLGDLQSSESPERLMPASFVEQMQRALALHTEPSLALDAFFGRDPRRRHDALAQQLFGTLRLPLVRAHFHRAGGTWTLRELSLLGINEVADESRTLIAEAARDYVTRSNRLRGKPPATGKASVAILYDDDEPQPPSNPEAIAKLCAAARTLGMRAEVIGRDDIDRLSRFDGLFIRDTTNVNHYTYQFARRAATDGLVVVDDPESILKCTNKVYLNELLSRHKVPVPKTLMVHRDNVEQIIPLLGLPCILKQPDSAFSLGVAKVETPEAVRAACARLFEKSDLVVAQEWLPTAFDWRVGVYDRRPLYVCKYFMAPGHWQVVKREPGRTLEGSTQALSVGEAPEIVVRTAVRAANLIGDGLYGVDLKQDGRQCYVMEVNDNPNLDAHSEDGVLKDALYREVMGVFLRRIQERRATAA
ncbi:MAG TPA: RimK family protein [Casimicrobiaceae bacterium]|jgi:glutathione synthase/RimK-type ligase-like ATP-grasp enzyme|nr:RimK family protein [Casimicrobiaceae bacterium]